MSSRLVRRGAGNAVIPPSDRIAMEISAGGRLPLIAESFARLAGKPLVEIAPAGFGQAIWDAPHVIVAHGLEPEPRLFYGNRIALELLAMSAVEFIGRAARTTAEPPLREERSRIVSGLAQDDIADIYGVVGIAANGRRYAISEGKVWNLVDRHGGRHGMGATYAAWQFLDRG